MVKKARGGLLFEERLNEGEDIFGYDFISVGGGMSVVALHHSVDAEDAFQKKRFRSGCKGKTGRQQEQRHRSSESVRISCHGESP
jgi:hypothetical protein